MSNKWQDLKHSLFDKFKDDKTDLLHPEKFYDELHTRGIRKSDPRIVKAIETIETHAEGKVDKEKFHR